MSSKVIKILIFLMLALIPVNPEVSACPSASIVHGWKCVDDVECLNFQSCDLWSHMCLTKAGYCGYDLVCKNSWEECANETHRCFPMQGYCNNESSCGLNQTCVNNRCILNDTFFGQGGDGGKPESFTNYLKAGLSSPLVLAALIIIAGIAVSLYINKKFS